MEEVEVLGRITLPMGAAVVGMDYISWNGRCWLVPTWLVPPDGNTRIPLRLVAPKMAPGFTAPAGPDMLGMFSKMPLPPSTYEQGHVPGDLANFVEIIENPPIFARM